MDGLQNAGTETFWTRWADGPPRQLKRTIGLQGEPAWRFQDRLWSDERALLLTITTSVSKARGYGTVGRYLGLDRMRPLEPIVSALDLLSVTVPTSAVRRLDHRPTVGPRSFASERARSRSGTAVGIDLAARGHEVGKLLWAGFGRRIVAAGLDFDDVLQEVHRGLLARNAGLSAWDPAKSGFGHYVHMVCGCVVSNLMKQQRRIEANEVVGMRVRGLKDESRGRIGDAGSDGAAQVAAEPDPVRKDTDDLNAMSGLQEHIGSGAGTETQRQLAMRLVPLLAAGMGKGEMSDALGEKMSSVTSALVLVRTAAKEWSGKLRAV